MSRRRGRECRLKFEADSFGVGAVEAFSCGEEYCSGGVLSGERKKDRMVEGNSKIATRPFSERTSSDGADDLRDRSG